MSDPRVGRSGDSRRYLVVEAHDSGARVVVWHGRGEKEAIRACYLLNERNVHPTIHYIVEEES